MSPSDALWFIGELGAAWLFGFVVGVQWKKFRDALLHAASLD